MQAAALTAALLLLTAAAPAPPPADLERALAGRWTGTLGYRDYQSNQLFTLKVDTEIRTLPDGATTIRVSTFDEGVRREPAVITSASLYDLKAGSVTVATLRKGRAVEVATTPLTVTAYADREHWTIVAEADGEDGDKPARLRTTEVRDGATLTATKEVRSAGAAEWRFRNVTTLSRVG